MNKERIEEGFRVGKEKGKVACMKVRLHPHAVARLSERGATEQEVILTIEGGEQFPAKYGRTGFRRNFVFQSTWAGKTFATKQIEAYAVEDNGWLIITVIAKYF